MHGAADTIFVGECESTWGQFIDDLLNGQTKSIYEGDIFKFDRQINPKKDIIKLKGLSKYSPKVWNIESSRGCPGSCSFCSSNSEYRTKPLDDLIEELETLPSRYVKFIDSNMGANKGRLNDILGYLKNKQLKWSANFYLPTLDKEIIANLAEAGCISVYIGFESVNPESLADANKPFNDVTQYGEIIKQLHDKGIGVVGSFVFGFDHDNSSIFERTIKQVEEIQLDDASFHILIPYPGTPLFDQLKMEDRLLYTNFPQDWRHYNRNEVAFVPKKMSPMELQEGYRAAIKEFYSPKSIYKRLVSNRAFSPGIALGIFANGIKCITTR